MPYVTDGMNLEEQYVVPAWVANQVKRPVDYDVVKPIIQRLHAEGGSLDEIAWELNAAGYRTPFGTQFGASSIRRILNWFC